jgi:hypothetical protein
MYVSKSPNYNNTNLAARDQDNIKSFTNTVSFDLTEPS